LQYHIIVSTATGVHAVGALLELLQRLKAASPANAVFHLQTTNNDLPNPPEISQ
jgi:hypothetical protein